MIKGGTQGPTQASNWPLGARLGAILLLFALSMAAGRAAASLLLPPVRTEADDARAEAYPRPGRQLVLVYVGSSRCGPSNASDLPSMVERISNQLRSVALADSIGFVRIGVAREVSARSGLMHLAKFNGFDEVSAGQGTLNATAEKYLSGDHRGDAATPQLIVIDRAIGGVFGGVDIDAVRERVLIRKVGLIEISNWLELGVPLPKPDSVK